MTVGVGVGSTQQGGVVASHLAHNDHGGDAGNHDTNAAQAHSAYHRMRQVSDDANHSPLTLAKLGVNHHGKGQALTDVVSQLTKDNEEVQLSRSKPPLTHTQAKPKPIRTCQRVRDIFTCS